MLLFVFLKKQVLNLRIANPILESKNSALVKQSDKMFKLFSRPNITTMICVNLKRLRLIFKSNI